METGRNAALIDTGTSQQRVPAQSTELNQLNTRPTLLEQTGEYNFRITTGNNNTHPTATINSPNITARACVGQANKTSATPQFAFGVPILVLFPILPVKFHRLVHPLVIIQLQLHLKLEVNFDMGILSLLEKTKRGQSKAPTQPTEMLWKPTRSHVIYKNKLRHCRHLSTTNWTNSPDWTPMFSIPRSIRTNAI